MSSWNKAVFSSHVQSVGYDDKTGEMTVTYQNGQTYAYQGVAEETAAALANAPSVGQMLNAEIKGQYKFRKV